MRRAGSIMKKIFNVLWKYKFTLLALLFLYFLCRSFHGVHNNQFVFQLLSFLFLFIGLSKVNKYVKWIVISILALIVTFEAYFGFIIGEHLSFGILESILLTHPSEAAGFMSGAILQTLGLILSILLVFGLSLKELGDIKVSKKVAFGVVAVYWFLYIPIFSLSRTAWSSDEDVVKLYLENPAYALYSRVAKKIPLILHDVLLYGAYCEQTKELEKYRDVKRELPNHVAVNDSVIAPLKVYIVLGESSNRANFSLYGYEQKTSPLLDSVAAVDSTLQIYQGVSSAPVTYLAIPMAFTFATPLDKEPMFRAKNIIELANDAGYETVWVSSQGILGVGDFDTSMFSFSASSRHHLGIYPYRDVELVPKLKELLVKDTKQFFILHQEGSHLDYSERFDDIDEKAFPNSDMVSQYDRTIHHTDRFLGSLIKTIEEEGSPYVLLFFSDHGEVIGKGHGFMSKGASQFEIPFVTKYKGNFPVSSVVSQYIDNETELINNLTVINIIAEIMGYQFTDEEKENVKNASKYIKHVNLDVYNYKDLKRDMLSK